MKTINIECPRCGAQPGTDCFDVRRVGEPRRRAHHGKYHDERTPTIVLEPDLVAFLAGRR